MPRPRSFCSAPVLPVGGGGGAPFTIGVTLQGRTPAATYDGNCSRLAPVSSDAQHTASQPRSASGLERGASGELLSPAEAPPASTVLPALTDECVRPSLEGNSHPLASALPGSPALLCPLHSTIPHSDSGISA